MLTIATKSLAPWKMMVLEPFRTGMRGSMPNLERLVKQALTDAFDRCPT